MPTLSAFIERAMKFFDKAEASTPDAKALSDLQAKVSSMETEKATLKADIDAQSKSISDRDAQIKDLTAQLEKATAETQTEKTRANNVIAGQGIRVEDIPAADAPKASGGEKAWDKYQRLMASNPREAGQFWAEKADEILASRI